MNVSEFVRILSSYHGRDVFNPWGEFDGIYDIGEMAPVLRRQNLERYFSLRPQADYIFMAEALGYQGGHFSGIALTCERMLLGGHRVSSAFILGDYQGLRTSNPAALTGPRQKWGFNEPSDTVVWEAVLQKGWDPFRVVMWNIFPFHPHFPGNPLSNRAPNAEELAAGFDYFLHLRTLYPQAKIIAIGKKCAGTVAKFGVECIEVRHPSMGGAGEFRKKVLSL